MRYGLFLFLSAICADAAFAQAAVVESNSDLAVIKHSWSKERLDWDNTEELTATAGPQTRPRIRMPPSYRKKTAAEQRSIRLSSSNAADRQPAEDPRFQFTYNVVVRNDSGKKIREIDWDYIFVDSATREEMGRRQFTSDDKIEAGKTKKLSVRVGTPPTHRVKAAQMGKSEAAGLTESVVIARILYEDGSEWKTN
jgi:hypothetical protein